MADASSTGFDRRDDPRVDPVLAQRRDEALPARRREGVPLGLLP